MSKIKLELFDKNVEITSFEYEKEYDLHFEFATDTKGYIILDGRCGQIHGKSCCVDVRELSEGEHIPRLILEEATVDLPKIINEHGLIYPSEHTLGEIGEISLRERRLCRRINELEEKFEQISKKVYGTTIF